MNANDFLMGGGGAKTAKFMGRNNPVTGTICRDPEVRQQTDYNTRELLFWPNGDPKMQLVVTIQTDQRDDADDDGQRALYIKGKSLTGAVRDAVRAAGAKGLEVGGTLTVTWVSGGPRYEGDQSWAKDNPKVYTATYQRPVNTAAAAFLGTDTTAADAAPAGDVDLPCPPGVPADKWAQMTGEQRRTVIAAMGQTG